MPLCEIIGLTSCSSKLKLTMHEATSRSGVSIILKTIVDSNKHQLLEYLSGIKVPSNHTIPLHQKKLKILFNTFFHFFSLFCKKVKKVKKRKALYLLNYFFNQSPKVHALLQVNYK